MRFSASRQRSGAHDGSKFAKKFRDEESRVCAKVAGKWPNGDRKYTSAETKKFVEIFVNTFSQMSSDGALAFGTVYRW